MKGSGSATGASRTFNGVLTLVSGALAAAIAAVAIWTAAFDVIDDAWFLAIVLAAGIVLSLVRDRGETIGRRAFNLGPAIAFLGLTAVWLRLILEQGTFFFEVSATQLALGWLAFGLIGHAILREFGRPMVLVCLATGGCVLAPIGGEVSRTRVSDNLWHSTDGAFGLPVQVAGRVVLIVKAFGAVLQASGPGRILLKMAFAASLRFTGGPAHVSMADQDVVAG